MGLNDKFLKKINVFKSKGAIILKQPSSHGFLCDIFNVHRIFYDYRFIDIMGLTFLMINFQKFQRTFLEKKIIFFHEFQRGKTTIVCEKTISMLFFSLSNSPSWGVVNSLSWGVVDSPTRESPTRRVIF